MFEVTKIVKKSVMSVIICFALAFCPAFVPSASALDDDSVSAPAAILMEAGTGKILYEKNSHEQRPCASVTKVMTLLLVFEAIDSGKLSLDDEITASEHAAGMGGSDIWLETGESMSADDMIKATVVASANDAAVALAEYLCGSEDEFVAKMNERAAQLGMNDTVFKNCNGLDEDGHVTSAYDVAVMSRELIKHEKIFDYTSIWLDTLRGGKTQIVNTNKLLKTYSGITGLKTGTTDDAGCCMSATAERDGVSLIAVVLGCETGKQRFSDAAALLDYGFANISVKELTLPEDMPETLDVSGGMEKSVQLNCNLGNNAEAVLDKSETTEITSQITLPESVEAPVNEGDRLGTVTYYAGESELCSYDITAAENVEQADFAALLRYAFTAMVGL